MLTPAAFVAVSSSGCSRPGTPRPQMPWSSMLRNRLGRLRRGGFAGCGLLGVGGQGVCALTAVGPRARGGVIRCRDARARRGSTAAPHHRSPTLSRLPLRCRQAPGGRHRLGQPDDPPSRTSCPLPAPFRSRGWAPAGGYQPRKSRPGPVNGEDRGQESGPRRGGRGGGQGLERDVISGADRGRGPVAASSATQQSRPNWAALRHTPCARATVAPLVDSRAAPCHSASYPPIEVGYLRTHPPIHRTVRHHGMVSGPFRSRNHIHDSIMGNMPC